MNTIHDATTREAAEDLELARSEPFRPGHPDDATPAVPPAFQRRKDWAAFLRTHALRAAGS